MILSSFLYAEHFYNNSEIAPWHIRREIDRLLHDKTQDAQQVTSLLDKTTDAQVKNRIAATRAIAQLGIVNDRIIEALITRLENNPSEGVKKWTALAFGNLGIRTPRAVEHLVKLATDSSSHVRHAVAMAIAELQEENLILTLLHSKNPVEREVVARSFVYMGRKAQKFLTHVENLSADTNVHVQREALWALNNITQYNNIRKKISVTIEQAQSTEKQLRDSAFSKLSNLGAQGIAIIIELASHSDTQVREKALRVLAKVRKTQEKAIGKEQQRLQQYIKSQLGDSQITAALSGETNIEIDKPQKYILTVENNGPDVAHDVAVNVHLPTSFSFHGKMGAIVLRWEIGSLAAKTPRTYSFTVIPLLAGKQQLTMSIKDATDREKQYVHSITVIESQQQRQRIFAIEIVGEEEVKDATAYQINVKNLHKMPQKNLLLQIFLPFNCYSKEQGRGVVNYEISHLDTEQVYQQNINLIGDFPGEGVLQAMIIGEDYVQKHNKIIKVNTEGLRTLLTTQQNPLGVDVQFATDRAQFVVGKKFRCCVSLYNKTSKLIENFDLNVVFPKNINPNNRGCGPRVFSWPDITLPPNSTRNVYVTCEAVEAGETQLKIYTEKNNQKLFEFSEKITITE